MGTSIEWTDVTWNPVTGCDKVSAGCKNCYAEGVADRFFAKQYSPNGDGSPRKFTDVRCHVDRLEQPLHWKKPRRVFVNSMSDLFHESVPDEFIAKIFAIMCLTPWHTYQVLTKRPERMREWLREYPIGNGLREFKGAILSTFGAMVESLKSTPPEVLNRAAEWLDKRYPDGDGFLRPWPLPNVWLGVSVESQKYADERIPLLLQTPAAVRFLSVEPMLEEVDLQHFQEHLPSSFHFGWLEGIHWVICGGESGAGARPFNLSWAESLLKQCKEAEVPFFMKQAGAWVMSDNQQHWIGHRGDVYPTGNGLETRWRILLKDSKGGDMSEWPEHLRVREFPV